jgi:putative cell wall-binding protein
VLGAAGYAEVLWSIDTYDCKGPSAATIAARVLARPRPGDIVLLHDGSRASQVVLALPAIIDGLRARNLCPGVLDDHGVVRPPAETWRFSPPQQVDVVAGANRFETALAASRLGWSTAPAAVVASGEVFPDALAAAPLAGVLGGPVLLTPSSQLHPGVVAELRRLGAPEVYAVGRLDDTVVAELQGTGIAVQVLRGPDRYATSVAVSQAALDHGADPSTVVVATGHDYPDSLSAGQIAAGSRHPLLLADPGEGPERLAALLRDWGTTRTIVVGGARAVPDRTIAGLPGLTRLAGPERTATAAAVAAWRVAEGIAPQPVVARADDFPDGLVGGVLAGRLGRALLLTPGDRVAPALGAWLGQHDPGHVLVLGGPAAVRPDVVCQLRAGTSSGDCR